MTSTVVTVRPDTSVTEALRLLIGHRISGLPVVEEDMTIVGILSEKDVLKLFYEEAESVASLMTRRPTTLSVDAPLVDAFDILMANDFRRVLIHENGKLVGLISRADVMPVLLEALLERSS